jgi:hypothetical protein
MKALRVLRTPEFERMDALKRSRSELPIVKGVEILKLL